MRIYTSPEQAIREVERDIWEMGINVSVQTMQDKDVSGDPNYMTKEVRHYGFSIVGWQWNFNDESMVIDYIFGKTQFATSKVLSYIEQEHTDRISHEPQNPGNSYMSRSEVWNEFLHDGKFAYTYSERIHPQLQRMIQELMDKPGTRQAIVNIHSNINPTRAWSANKMTHWVTEGADLQNMGGYGRIPCSMYYQLMRREDKLDLIYTMRSCDFLTHFPIDLMLALRMQDYVANRLGVPAGLFTYFTGSLHAYSKDMKTRGIF